MQVEEFFQYAKNVSEAYRSNNILITMGEDFNYQSADMWYKNLDKLIKWVIDAWLPKCHSRYNNPNLKIP